MFPKSCSKAPLVCAISSPSKTENVMNPFNSPECQKSQFKKNPKFNFVKYQKMNDAMQKYCQKGFISMVRP